jgi:hypothetical protein
MNGRDCARFAFIAMLRGLSFLACESSPGAVMQIEYFSVLANVVHSRLEEIFKGMSYVTVQRGAA